MGIFEFVKSTGQAVSANLAKAAEAAKVGSPGAAAMGVTTAPAADEKTDGQVTVEALEAKIKGAKVVHHDLAIKMVDSHTVKIYAVVEDADAKSDLILLIGNTPGVSTVQDSIKVRAPGSDHEVEGPAPRFYQVKSGDTLSAIALAELGDEGRFMEIFKANRHVLTDPNQIDVGQTLKIPQE